MFSSPSGFRCLVRAALCSVYLILTMSSHHFLAPCATLMSLWLDGEHPTVLWTGKLWGPSLSTGTHCSHFSSCIGRSWWDLRDPSGSFGSIIGSGGMEVEVWKTDFLLLLYAGRPIIISQDRHRWQPLLRDFFASTVSFFSFGLTVLSRHKKI